MRKILALIAAICILALPVFAHETGETHEEPEACAAEEFEESGRGCAFAISEEGPATLGEWLITKFRPGFEEKTAAQALAGIGAAIVLLLAVLKWTKTPAKKRRASFWLKTFGGITAVLAIVYIMHASYYHWYSGVSTAGIEICDDRGCRISMHWHATLEEMSVCGQTVERPWEKGDLAGPHTHKDNKIHLHTILPIDPQTKEILDTYPMTLGGFFDSIEWKFSQNCFEDACDTCNGQPASTKVWRNGNLVEENIRDLIWKDGDTLVIKFE